MAIPDYSPVDDNNNNTGSDDQNSFEERSRSMGNSGKKDCKFRDKHECEYDCGWNDEIQKCTQLVSKKVVRKYMHIGITGIFIALLFLAAFITWIRFSVNSFASSRKREQDTRLFFGISSGILGVISIVVLGLGWGKYVNFKDPKKYTIVKYN